MATVIEVMQSVLRAVERKADKARMDEVMEVRDALNKLQRRRNRRPRRKELQPAG
jgi:hypothetical protein